MAKYNTLTFNKFNEEQDMATLTLLGGCLVKIVRTNKPSGLPPFISHDAKLVNSSKHTLDEEEGLDKEELMEFIGKCEDLAAEVAAELDLVGNVMAESIS